MHFSQVSSWALNVQSSRSTGCHRCGLFCMRGVVLLRTGNIPKSLRATKKKLCFLKQNFSIHRATQPKKNTNGVRRITRMKKRVSFHRSLGNFQLWLGLGVILPDPKPTRPPHAGEMASGDQLYLGESGEASEMALQEPQTWFFCTFSKPLGVETQASWKFRSCFKNQYDNG